MTTGNHRKVAYIEDACCMLSRIHAVSTVNINESYTVNNKQLREWLIEDK